MKVLQASRLIRGRRNRAPLILDVLNALTRYSAVVPVGHLLAQRIWWLRFHFDSIGWVLFLKFRA